MTGKILKAIEETKRQTLQYEVTRSLEAYIARVNMQMLDGSSLGVVAVRDGTPDDFYDRSIRAPIKVGGGYKNGFPVGFQPGMAVDGIVNKDLNRELSPEGQKKRWDEALRRQNGEF